VGTDIPPMDRASHGVFAKHEWPGTRHSSSAEDGHHWRSEQVSDWMSAKDVPQKNLYLWEGSGWALVARRGDRRRRRAAVGGREEEDRIVVVVVGDGELVVVMIC